jgi:Zn ribbon nucleic-acid-binding protein
MAWEGKKCPNCGNFDSLVELPRELRDVTWPQHDGRVYQVHQYRCLACGAADIIQRDFLERHKNDQTVMGQFAESDGRMFIARPLTKED